MEEGSGQRESKEKAPNIIKDLVERFERHLSSYEGQGYNEAQLRQEFINPFFEALGWDVYNKSGAAPSYRDVIHEDAIKMGGGVKAPDYCFTLSGRRMFFVETKKPSVDITKDTHPAYQLRRYSWSAELPLSILTNFEEFAIYESRQKPKQGDKTNIERTLLITYKDYIEKWDEIASIFSKKAVLQGSFDRYIELAKKKRGTQEVDDEFLKEIEGWREALAGNIAIRNTQLSVRELNDAVQKTIDRIIFLRMCEDRGIEQYGQLLSLLERENIYPHLCKIYEKADEKYNSGLFHFKKERERSTPPDEITLKLTIDDKVLKEIIKHIYYPESPYEFSVLRPEILGNVYEQFLGKVIRLTEGHRAKVEEKPEVKKAGGVYYTPEYIVDYIVKNTVGKLCEGKTPKQVEKLHILDPACGSGSFLLGAYSYLLTYHLNYYTNRKNPKSYKEQIYQRKDGQWFLTTKEKKRILLNNIYGVDIDSQAVEVTKLSLLLKVLEGESKDVYEKQQKLWRERVLPDLGDNIKCGNSLIEPDIYNNFQTKLFEDEEMYHINAFDWGTEFKEIIDNGGFDVVIGNPPYGSLFADKEVAYINEKLPVFKTIPDAYVAFIEKAHQLLSEGGRFGYIIPSAWLGGPAYINLRNFLLQFRIETVISLPFDIFKDAYIDTVLLMTVKISPNSKHNVLTYEYPKKERITSINLLTLKPSKINQLTWCKTENCKFILDADMLSILATIRKKVGGNLEKIVIMRRGVLFDRTLLTNKKVSEKSFPYYEGDVYRYRIQYHAPMWIEFGPKMKEYPRDFHWFEGERILLRRLVNRQQRLMASLISKTVITNKNLYVIKPIGNESIKYILGVINSLLFSRMYLSQISQATKDDFPQVTVRDIRSLPIRTIDFSNPNDKTLHDKMVKLVEQMLDFHKRFARATADVERTMLQRQIDAIDKQIDQLVYELYALSNDEIEQIEQKRNKK